MSTTETKQQAPASKEKAVEPIATSSPIYPEFTAELLAKAKQAGEEPANGKAAEEPTNGKTDEEPTDGKTGAEPADGKTDEEPTDGKTDAEPEESTLEESSEFQTLTKRFKDTQASLHKKSTELKKAEAKLRKAADVLLKNIKTQNIDLTDEESALAYDNPAELARIYAEKMEAKKEQTLGAIELNEDEVKAIEAEANADVEKTEGELSAKAFDELKAEVVDFEEIVNDDVIKKYVTDEDREQFAEIREKRGHAAMFKAAYEKLKPLVKGIQKAKEKMQEGSKAPEVKSLSNVGSADPDETAAAVTMEKAWKSGKL